MRYLENEDLTKEIKEGLHIVDFYAEWCGPCQMMSMILDKITDIDIIKVNVDKFQKLVSEYNIMSIPKLLFIKDGKVINEYKGFQSEEKIKKEIKKLKNLN